VWWCRCGIRIWDGTFRVTHSQWLRLCCLCLLLSFLCLPLPRFNIVVFILILNMFIAIINLYFVTVHAETAVAEGWKHGMTDLSFEVIKDMRRMSRLYVCAKCPRLCGIIRCRPCRGKMSAAEAPSRQLEVRVAACMANRRCVCVCFSFTRPLTLRLNHGVHVWSGDWLVTLLLFCWQVWYHEAAVISAFRAAARAAKRRDRSIDLYQYFDRACVYRLASYTIPSCHPCTPELGFCVLCLF